MGERGVFENLKVIDLGSWLAAPTTATVMADFGADVIKIEPPPIGDRYRFTQFIPGFPKAEDNYAWLLTNRSKRSIGLDLKQQSGYAVFLDLVAAADVLITNYQPGALERLKARYEDVADTNPRLVYGQLSGYGEQGRDANMRGFDRSSWWARSGMMHAMRYRDQPPTSGVLGWGDHFSAMSLFAAVMMGLYRRERTGEGGKVSTSLLANGLWANAVPLQAALGGAEIQQETPRLDWDNSIAIPYRCRDGHWFCPWYFEETSGWVAFATAVGLEKLTSDPRFIEEQARKKNAKALIAELDAKIAEKDWAQWREIFDRDEVPYFPVATTDDVLCDPQIEINEGFLHFEDAPYRTERTVNSPVWVDGVAKRTPRPAPEYGEHSQEVLRELGYDEDRIDALRQQGVVK